MFRAIQMIQDKAQFAGNGESGTPSRGRRVLSKDCNAGLDHLVRSLRASREALVRGVATLGKDWAIPCEARLAAKRFPTR